MLWAAFFNFVAAFVLGTHVAKTMGNGMIDLSVVTQEVILAGLLGAVFWNLVTWYFGLPVSSSHALIGGYAGAAVAKAGFSAILLSGWSKTLRTISLPLLAPTLAAGAIYTILRAFRELSASLLLASFGNEPYSVVAYHMWEGGETSKTAAYGMLAIVLMTVVVVATQRLTGRRYAGE